MNQNYWYATPKQISTECTELDGRSSNSGRENIQNARSNIILISAYYL